MKTIKQSELCCKLTDILGHIVLRIQELRDDLWPYFATENMPLSEEERLRLEVELRSPGDGDWWYDIDTTAALEPLEKKHPQLLLYAVPDALLRQGRCKEALRFLKIIGDKVTFEEKLQRLAHYCADRGDFPSVLELLETTIDLGTRLEIWGLCFYILASRDHLRDMARHVRTFTDVGIELEKLRGAERELLKCQISWEHVSDLLDHGFVDEAKKLVSSVADTDVRHELLGRISWKQARACDFVSAEQTLKGLDDKSLHDDLLCLLAIDLACQGRYDEAYRAHSRISSERQRDFIATFIPVIQGTVSELDCKPVLEGQDRFLMNAVESLARYGRFDMAKPFLALVLDDIGGCNRCAELGYVDESAEAVIIWAASDRLSSLDAVWFVTQTAVGSAVIGRPPEETVRSMEGFLQRVRCLEPIHTGKAFTELAVNLLKEISDADLSAARDTNNQYSSSPEAER